MLGERSRRPEIDYLKGFAILCVLAIHARVAVDTILWTYIINRAVPMFLVLFGLTSELWYAREEQAEQTRGGTARRWYWSRFRRLMPPVWGTVAVWIGLVVLLGGPLVVTPKVLVGLGLGYLPWVGTGWFVTLILQLVILYPIVRLVERTMGSVPTVLAAFGLVLAGRLFPIQVITLMEWIGNQRGGTSGIWYLEIFAPTKLLWVCAGMLMARRAAPVPVKAVALCVLLVVAGDALHASIESDNLREIILTLTDIPLVIALLAGMRTAGARPAGGAWLAWCGVSSWGIYLGQMLVHEWVHLLGLKPEEMAPVYRVAYMAGLFVGALGFVAIGEAVRKRASWRPETHSYA